MLDEVVADREAALTAAMATLRTDQQDARDAYARRIEETRDETVANFLSPKSGREYAKLLDADEYGRQHIRLTPPYYSGLTPGQAEDLAARLLELAAESRAALKGA